MRRLAVTLRGTDRRTKLRNLATMTSTAVSLSIPPWLEEICVRLRSNDPTLTNLNLNIRRLTEFTLAYLCDALTNNSHLETLNLTNCLVPPVNLQPLGQALARHASLRALHLSYNKLVNINDLALCLGTNTSLEELFLNYNQIQEDVAALAEALKYNTTLKVLHLGKNRIDDRGAAALARVIEHNSSLRLMSLVWNEIESQGIKCLLQSLQQNLVLEVLELDQNP